MAARGQGRSRDLPPGVGTERGLQFTDLDGQGARAAESIMKGAGRGVKAKTRSRIAQIEGGSNKKARIKAAALTAVSSALTNQDTSIEAGAQRRADLVRGGFARQRAQESAGVSGDNTGVGWYLRHAQDLVDIADLHQMDSRRVAKASVMLSPQNSPENEKAAVSAIADAHSRVTGIDSVTTTPAVRRSAGGSLPNSKNLSVTDLTSNQFANLSTAASRSAVQKDSDTDLYQLSRGGTKTNIANATDVIRGNSVSLDHLSNPKLSAYGGAIEMARQSLGTGADSEYLQRVGHAKDVLGGSQSKGQGYLDLWGHKDSKEGILNPSANTAEDTWMNAIHTGQPLTSEGSGRGSVPAKVHGSGDDHYKIGKTDDKGVSAHPNPAVRGSSIAHAVNNASTIRAAEMIGHDVGLVNASGESMMPSTATQETAWTEVRRRAGKDPEYSQSGMPRGDFDSERANSFSPQFHGKFETSEPKKSSGGKQPKVKPVAKPEQLSLF